MSYKIKVNKKRLKKIADYNIRELLSYFIWGHLKDERYKNAGTIEITKSFYGKRKNGGGGSYSDSWNNPDYKELGYIRKFNKMTIKFEWQNITYNILIWHHGNIKMLVTREKGNSRYETPLSSIKVANWLIKNKIWIIK